MTVLCTICADGCAVFWIVKYVYLTIFRPCFNATVRLEEDLCAGVSFAAGSSVLCRPVALWSLFDIVSARYFLERSTQIREGILFIHVAAYLVSVKSFNVRVNHIHDAHYLPFIIVVMAVGNICVLSLPPP